MASTDKIFTKIIISSTLTVSPWFFGLPFLSLIGLILFVLILRDIRQNLSKRDGLYLIFTWSLVYNLAVLGSWTYSIIPMTQFGIPDLKYSVAIAGFIWLITAIGFSLPSLIFGLIFYKKNNKYLNLIFLSALWLVYEYARAHMMSLVWYSEQAHIGPHFAMGTIGYYFHNSDIARYISTFIGVFGLGFLLILLANYLAKIYFEQKYKKLYVILVIFVIAIYTPLPHSKSNGQEVAFALIQTNRKMAIDYTPREKRDHLQNIFSLISEAGEKIPKDTKGLIVLPEASDLFEEGQSLISREGIEAFLNSNIGDNTAIIVEEDTPIVPEKVRYGASVLYSKIKAEPSYYKKTILSPGSEYLSNAMQGISRMFIGTTVTQELVDQTFTPNSYEAHTITWNGIKLAPFTCSDVLSPDFVNLQSKPAELGYVHVNLGYTRGNPQIENYTFSQARLNTTQSGIPLLLSANVGRSVVFDKDGEIVARTAGYDNEVLTGKIATSSKNTWYNLFGDWPIILASLAISLISVFYRQNKHKREK